MGRTKKSQPIEKKVNSDPKFFNKGEAINLLRESTHTEVNEKQKMITGITPVIPFKEVGAISYLHKHHDFDFHHKGNV